MSSPLLTVFTALRLCVGVLSWAAPDTSVRVFGLPPTPQPLVTRLFGARDTALALAAHDRDPVVARRALQIGLAIDSIDALGALIDVRRGRIGRRAAILGGGGAVFFAVLGGLSLRPRPEGLAA
ncbi:MAG: hypothetical protein H7Y15_01350 [Pseudonocardia sp.]|nr:hypothetical protein [Pseudonocardia sp.]